MANGHSILQNKYRMKYGHSILKNKYRMKHSLSNPTQKKDETVILKHTYKVWSKSTVI